MKSTNLTYLVLFFTLGLPVFGQSPLFVRSNFLPSYLVKKILLNETSAVTVSNINYTGSDLAIGAFSNSSKYYIMKKGIILSTGNVDDAIGPNGSTNKGQPLGNSGSKILEEFSTGKTYDACELSFDFVPEYDSIKFNFVFASEEYPEFVNKGVNDIFGFFIQDLESEEVRNLAVVGPKKIPVNVDNINATRFSELYIENGIWDQNNILKWKDKPGLGELALTYEFDGFTTLLAAGCLVIPGHSYRITFAIADVGDKLYDSAVFLEEGSFNSFGNKKDEKEALYDKIRMEFQEPSIEVRKGQSAVILSLMVNFDFDQSAVTADSSLKILNRIIRFLKLNSELLLSIGGHTDNIGNAEYNMNLSNRRAVFAAEYFGNAGIESNRIKIKAYGDSQPITDNITSQGRLKNRRIEFVFSKD